MPVGRRKPKRIKKNHELPPHIKRADLGLHNWRVQCKIVKYPKDLSLTSSLSDVIFLRWVIIRTQAELWSHVVSMCVSMSLSSDYVEPLFAISNKVLVTKGRMLGIQLYMVIRMSMRNPDQLLKRETILIEEKFDPPDLFEYMLRVKRLEKKDESSLPEY